MDFCNVPLVLAAGETKTWSQGLWEAAACCASSHTCIDLRGFSSAAKGQFYLKSEF